MSHLWTAQVAALPAITLDQLEAQAALLTRVDRKYIVSAGHLEEVLASLSPARALEIGGRRSFRYASEYMDTPALTSFHAAAHRRPARFKVRTREYLDSGTTAVEVKLRSAKGETVKHRLLLDAAPDAPDSTTSLDPTGREFIASFPAVAPYVDQLAPVLRTTYVRSTLVTPDGRVTLDRAVTASQRTGVAVSFGEAVIVETKSTLRAGAMDHALWARGLRPVRVSKYCTALAALHPDLPSNRWARTLRRHLSPKD